MVWTFTHCVDRTEPIINESMQNNNYLCNWSKKLVFIILDIKLSPNKVGIYLIRGLYDKYTPTSSQLWAIAAPVCQMRKGNKSLDNPSSNRLRCLLGVEGIRYEQLLLSILNAKLGGLYKKRVLRESSEGNWYMRRYYWKQREELK